jgi:hypothetical protein
MRSYAVDRAESAGLILGFVFIGFIMGLAI